MIICRRDGVNERRAAGNADFCGRAVRDRTCVRWSFRLQLLECGFQDIFETFSSAEPVNW